MFKRLMLKIADRIYNYRLYRDINKLLDQPRYQPGKSLLFGLPLYYVDVSTFYYGYKEIFNDEPYMFNTETIEPLIIDCGANIGLSTIYFKKQHPLSKIISFEADPDIFKILKKNVEINELSNVELINKAIWIDNSYIDFEVEGGFSGRINKYQSVTNIIKVETQRLNDLLIRKIDFLKIDIEGAEFEVIKDCYKNLYLVKYIFIEYHSHVSEKQKLGELLLLLTETGFRYHIKEAFSVKRPFVQKEEMLGMELQLNIFAINNNEG